MLEPAAGWHAGACLIKASSIWSFPGEPSHHTEGQVEGQIQTFTAQLYRDDLELATEAARAGA